jgi:hypothetical protein
MEAQQCEVAVHPLNAGGAKRGHLREDVAYYSSGGVVGIDKNRETEGLVRDSVISLGKGGYVHARRSRRSSRVIVEI